MTTKCLQNYLRGELQDSVPANTITNKTLGARLHMCIHSPLNLPSACFTQCLKKPT